MDKIKWIDNNLEMLIQEFNQGISIKIKLYYSQNIYNIVNPVLSRNIHSSNCFKYFCNYKYDKSIPRKISLSIKILKIIKYYIKSLVHFIVIFLHLLTYKLAYRKNKPLKDDDILLVDTFTMIDKIYPKGYKDNYFGEMNNILEEKKVNFAILTILFGDKAFNLKRRFLTYKLLNQDNKLFLTEFEFLKPIDYLKLFYFTITYPFFHLRTKSKDNINIFDTIYNVSIDETLDTIQFHYYVRYLFAKRLGEYFQGNIKLITWDENQIIHKLLNIGFREKTDKVYIIGTKFFGFAPSWLNLVNIEIEKEIGVSPDIILLKGKTFGKYFKTIDFKIGFAPRESYLYHINRVKKKKDNIGLLLGYDIEENKRIISILQQVDLYKSKNIIVRLHPNHKLTVPFILPSSWVIDNGDILSFSTSCYKILSVGTGAALELMCMNNFILLLGGEMEATTNVLLSNLKYTNWDIFYNKEDLEILLKKDNLSLQNVNLSDIFEKMTEEKILKYLKLEELRI